MDCTQLCVLLISIFLTFANASNSTEHKITNGQTASRYQFPYLASYQNDGEHFCGCTILNAEWLLTAAHCIHEAQRYPIENLLIVAGITKLYENSSHSQSSLIFRQHMHPGWGGGIGPDDIGLIRIKTPFKWTSDVSWIALPFANREYEGVIVIAGWGYRRSSYPVPSVALQYARGGTISTNQCNRIINPYAIRVDDRSVCTLGYDLGSETSCEGDSGGPVVYPDYPNKPIQIGVMSWNLSPCGIKHTPSVSTKVSKYIGWIKCRVEMDYVAPSAPCN